MKYSATIILIILANLVFAQSQEMSLKKCLDFALENSYTIKNAKLDIENNEYVMREQKAAALPKVNAHSSYTNNIGLPTRILTGSFPPGAPEQQVAITFGVDNYIDFGLRLDQQFSVAIFTALKLKKPSRELFQQLLSRSEDEIIYDIAKQYYGILKNEEQKKVIEVNLERLDKLLKMVQLQVENDFGKPTDIKNIELKIADVQVLKTQLDAGISVQYQALKLLMGMDLNEKIVIEDFQPNAVLPADMNPPAAEQVSNLQLLETQKLLRKLEQDLIKKEAIPTLGFVAYYGGQFQDNGLEFSNNDNWNSVTYWGLNLRLPIYDGKNRKSRVQQADVTLKKLDNNYEQAAAYSQFEFEKTAAELRSQLAVMNAQQQKIQVLQELYNQTILQYRESTSSLVELLNAEADLRQAELIYSTQLFDYQLIILNYYKNKGMLKDLK